MPFIAMIAIEGHRLPLSPIDVAGFLYVTTEHHRLPGQQDAARDATDIHPDDLAADGPQEARLVKSSDFVTLYRGHPLTLVYASHLEFNKAPSHVRFGSNADIAKSDRNVR
jgi:hypothetical protein